MNLDKTKFETSLKSMDFEINGDLYERKRCPIIRDYFKNLEEFWKFFIVPQTNRIDDEIKKPDNKIRKRKDTSHDLYDIAMANYSIFIHLVYAEELLVNPILSSFEDFYTHLASVCDISEDLLLRFYLLCNECICEKNKKIEELNKEKFLKLAEEWYTKNYKKLKKFYLEKGKIRPIRIPTKNNILDDFFRGEGNSNWKRYKRIAQQIREYRNVIVHNNLIASISKENGIKYVPKKEKIHNYTKWQSVFKISEDKETFKTDFINQKQQMIEDFDTIQKTLNPLWSKIVTIHKDLLFNQENKILLKKFNINFQ